MITGNNCLVITLTGLGIVPSYGMGDETIPFVIDESVVEGYCLRASEFFRVKFDAFPCLVLFRNMRTPEHILVTLKGLSAEEIALEMRTLFSVVKEAVQQNRDPITAVEEYNQQRTFSEKKKAVWSHVQSFAGRTFEMLVEVFAKAVIQ